MTTYTKEEIEEILRTEKFPYQRVELPFGLSTPGQDRSQTRDLIFPKKLTGQTVLDVGCALGYFSFEAEKLGAARILGIELSDLRFRQANLLKKILGSNVEFQQRDILGDELNEQFDVVLLLNVIHHLPEPMSALRKVASICRNRLVLEFPTFADQRFRRSAGIKFSWLYERLPLIGVSSMEPNTDQTFVFTKGAIRRVLLDHRALFKRVEFIASPMPGRLLAICEK